MSSEWTPTTEEVRSAFDPLPLPAGREFDPLGQMDESEWSRWRDAAFDRWLAEHDRQIAEKTRLSYQWHPSNLVRNRMFDSKNLEDVL